MTGLRFGVSTPEVLEAFVASIADAVYVVDPDGRVQFVNPAGLELLGYQAESELLGQPSHATIHHHRPDGSAFPEADCPLLRPRVTGETVRVEQDWFIRRDGRVVPVAYSSAPINMDRGRGAVVVFRDISERLQAEEARRREEVERARAESLHASRARLVATADAERRRLSRDLHDGAQQRLVNVMIALQLAQQQMDADAPRARELVGEALEEARSAIADLRDLAAGLHPAVLTNRGLRAAVETLTGRAPIPVTFEIVGDRFDASVEAAAYFVIAEALTNVAKHAEASEASVEVAVGDDRLFIDVRDDGNGGARFEGGSGLRGLEDRITTLGGSLALVSPAGGGTWLHAELPLAGSQAELAGP